MADGLFAMLMSVKGLMPKIRYDEGSNICQYLAQELDSRIV